MNDPKKTWVNSMFSQLAHFENANSTVKNKRCKETPCSASKKLSKERSPDDMSFTVRSTTDLVGKVEKIQQDAKISNENWIDFFAPTKSEELAIHPKKLQEIKQWFDHCSVMKHKNSAQICLLTGPSGSGKTTAVRILARENKISVQEWINPVDQEIIYNLGDQPIGQSFVSSQSDAFKNFLFQASRYRSLFETNTRNKCLLMVEDFPNFIIRDSTILHDILEDYVNYAKSPLIFIVTDAKNRGLNISYNIFTDQLRQKFSIHHINFNAIASTIMQKSMKRFCSLMRSPTHNKIYEIPSQDMVDSIVISAQGDIRNALINLHFSSLKGAPKLLTKPLKNEEEKISRKRKGERKLKSVGRDESVTVMHALGRVFNPKFTQHKRFVHSPEEVMEGFTTEPKKVIDLIHANYIPHFRDIEYLLEATDGLSVCDVILNEYRDESLLSVGLNVGIRSVMVANTNPVTGWMPVKGQKRIDLSTAKMLPLACKALPIHHNISSTLYALDYKSFLNVIAP